MNRLALITDIPDQKEIARRTKLLQEHSYEVSHFLTPDDYINAHDPRDLVVSACCFKSLDERIGWQHILRLLKGTADSKEAVLTYSIYSVFRSDFDGFLRQLTANSNATQSRIIGHVYMNRYANIPDLEPFRDHVLPVVKKILPLRPSEVAALDRLFGGCVPRS
jgi:hypothetical protein